MKGLNYEMRLLNEVLPNYAIRDLHLDINC